MSSHEPIVVTHAGAARFAARVRTHTVLTDQTTRGGGDDLAPTPVELLGAALGTCVALYVQRFLDVRGLSQEGLRVEVQSHKASHPNRIEAFDVHVVLPSALPSHYAEMIERVAHSCPVHNTLARSTEIRVRIETPEGALR